MSRKELRIRAVQFQMKGERSVQNKRQFDLGQESSFAKLPAEVILHNEPYFLVKNDAGYELLSALCPHAGGTVMEYGEDLVCPLHFWIFDGSTGQCKNVYGECLTAHPVFVRDGKLIAEI